MLDSQSLLTAGMKMSLRGQMQINCTSKPQTKTGNFSAHIKRANTLGYKKEHSTDRRKSSTIFDRSNSQASQMEVWDHTALVKQRGKPEEAVLLDRGTGSWVKGQTTENETPIKSQSCLGGWELNT